MGNLEEFGNGHKGAANTPVTGSEVTGGEAASAEVASAPSFPIRRVVSSSPGLSSTSEAKSEEPETMSVSEFIAKGGKLAPEEAKTLKVKQEELPSEAPVTKTPADETPKMGRKERFKAEKASVKAPKESQSESAYEDKLRKRMPWPGKTSVSRPQESILTGSASNLKVLTDHWNKVNSVMKDDVSNPAFATHAEVGARLSLAAAYLGASRAAKGKNQNVSHEHMKVATEALHDANKMMWNNTAYSITAGSNPPIGTAATDENRAHALVEFPTRKEAGRLANSLKIGRGTYDIKGSQISSKVENTQEFYERLEQMKTEMNHPDPSISGKYAGINRGAFAHVYKLATKPTPRGGSQWGPTNPGPNSLNGRFGTGNLISPYGVGNDIKNVSQGSNFDTGKPTVAVRTTIPMVQTHPSPLPANADIIRHKKTGQIWASVNGVPVDKMPEDKDKVMVPFGQHIGLKVTDSFGREVPHVNEKGNPLSLSKLRKANAHIKTTVKYSSPPSAPNAPKPSVAAEPTTPRALTAKELNEQSKKERLKSENSSDIDRAQADMSDAIEHAYAIVQQRKLEKKATPRKRSAASVVNTLGQDIAKSAKPAKSKGKGK